VTTELAPEVSHAPIGTSLAPRARARSETGLKRKDRMRLAEYDRLRETGKGAIEAWREVRANPDLAFKFARRDDCDSRVAADLSHFLDRVAPERILRGRRDLGETIPAAVNAIGDIIRGDFGEARVRTLQNGSEVVLVDAAAAGVRSQNARWLLERVGVVSPANGPGVAVQVNVGTLHDAAAALSRDPDLRAAAIDLARKASPEA